MEREAEIEGSVRDGQSLLSRLLTTIAFDMWADCGLAVEFRIRIVGEPNAMLALKDVHAIVGNAGGMHICRERPSSIPVL